MNELEKTPAIGMSVQCTLNGKRTVVFQTFVAADSPVSVINEMLGKLHDAADRQEARYLVHDFELHKEVAESQLRTIQEDIADYYAECEAEWQQSGRKGVFKLSQQQRAHMKTLDKSLKNTDASVKKVTVNLDEYRAKAQGKVTA